MLTETTGFTKTGGTLSPLDQPHVQTVAYQYDGLSRRTHTYTNYQDLVHPFGPIPFVTKSYDSLSIVEYDEGGNVVWIESGRSTNLTPQISKTVMKYNLFGRNVMVVQGADTPIATASESRYDAAGNTVWTQSGVAVSSNAPENYSHPTITVSKYDALNRPTEVIVGANSKTADGKSNSIRTTSEYDAAGNRVKIVTWANKQERNGLPVKIVTRLQYDNLDRQVGTIEAEGTNVERRSETVYDSIDNPILVTTGIAKSELQISGTPTSYARPVTTAYSYDNLGRVVRVYENWSNRLIQPIQQTFSAGIGIVGGLLGAINTAHSEHVTVTNYNSNDNIVSITTPGPDGYPEGVTSRFQYDRIGRKIEVTEAVGAEYQGESLARTTKYRYDGAGNVVEILSADNVITRLAYSASGHLVSMIEAFERPEQRSSQFTYDSSGNRTFQTVGIGNSYFDTNWKLVPLGTSQSVPAQSIMYSHESTTKYSYDAIGRLTSNYEGWGNADPNVGRQTMVKYDSSGNITESTAGLPNTPSQLYLIHIATSKTEYDSVGRPTLQLVDQSRNDDLGNHVTTWSAFTSQYDAYGNLFTQSTPLPSGGAGSARTSHFYDELGRIIRIVHPRGQRVQWNHNSSRLLVLPLGMNDVSESMQYDAANHVVKLTDVEDNKTLYSYDYAGRPTSQSVEHDKHGVLTTRSRYDRTGNLVAIVSPSGMTTLTRYDAFNQPRYVTEQDSLLPTQYRYDNTGRLVSMTNRNFDTRIYDYDSLGKVTSEKWVYLGKAEQLTQAEFAYDASDNVLRAASPSSIYYFTSYDALNQLRTEWQPRAITTLVENQNAMFRRVDYDYDTSGNRITERDYGQMELFAQPVNPVPVATTESKYDNANRLISRTLSYSKPTGVESAKLSIDYGPLGHKLHITRSNTQGGSQLITISTSEYKYDNSGRLYYQYDVSNSGVQDIVYYDMDNRGYVTAEYRRLEPAKPWSVLRYSYDSIGQLTATTANGVEEKTAYDRNGNPRSIGKYDACYVPDGENLTVYDAPDRLYQLVHWGSEHRSYRYDSEGNRVRDVLSRPS